jgi:uncharacterized protein with HEPN domain
VIRSIEIIGEASNNIEKHFPRFVANHSELPLASAYQMRNAVAHGYFKVDFKSYEEHSIPTLQAFVTWFWPLQSYWFKGQDIVATRKSSVS